MTPAPAAPSPRREHTVAARLAGTSLLVSLAATPLLAVGGGEPLADPVVAVAVVLAIAGVAALPVAAAVLLVRPTGLLGRGGLAAAAIATLVGITAETLFPLSFGAGMNDADAGRELGLLGSLTWPLALAAWIGLAVATAVVVFALVRRAMAPPAALAVAVVAGAVAGAALTIAFYAMPAAPTASLGVFLTAVLTGERPRRRAETTAPTAAEAALGWTSAGGTFVARVRLLAAASVAYTVVVWSGGLAASIAGTGTDVATSALGIANGAAGLAVVPLLWAVTAIAARRLPGSARSLWAVFVVASVVAAVAAGIMVVGYSPDGDRFVALLAGPSLGIGMWVGALAMPLTRGWPGFERGLTVAVAVIGGACAYLAGSAATGGLGLLAASVYLVVAGRRLARGKLRSPQPA